jgi:hypothetical protein
MCMYYQKIEIISVLYPALLIKKETFYLGLFFTVKSGFKNSAVIFEINFTKKIMRSGFVFRVKELQKLS